MTARTGRGRAAVRHFAADDVAMRSWLAVCRWVDDAAPFPGEAFRRWVRDFYQRDELIAGRVQLRARRVDLTAVRCALRAAEHRGAVGPHRPADADHRHGSNGGWPRHDVAARDAGHVGMLIGPSAMTGLWPSVADWLVTRSD